jgi:hypothetical protein
LTRLAVAGLAAAASLVTAAATAAAPPFVINGDRVVGGFTMVGTLAQAKKVFGAPTSVRIPPGSSECDVVWKPLGLKAFVIDPQGRQPCKFGVVSTLTMSSPKWRTNKGLHVGSTVAQLRKLYPRAGYHGAQSGFVGYWLITRSGCEFDFPGLLAKIVGGRVSALEVTAAVCD